MTGLTGGTRPGPEGILTVVETFSVRILEGFAKYKLDLVNIRIV